MNVSDPSNNDQSANTTQKGADQHETSEMTDEARQVIGSARRSFGFSMSILILGFMAIVLALVYRATKDDISAADRFLLEMVVVPEGAVVRSIVPNDDILSITYDLNGQTHWLLLDGETGAEIRNIPVGVAPLEIAPTEE